MVVRCLAAILFCLPRFVLAADSLKAKLPYPGWKYAAEILIGNPAPFPREKAFIDAEVAVPGERAGNIPGDVRVVLKHGFDSLLNELPSQVYAVRRRGDYAVFRVAFFLDVPSNGQQRVAVLYDNPAAKPPAYPSKSWQSRQSAGRMEASNEFYEAVVDRKYARLAALKYRPANIDLSSPSPTDLCGLFLAPGPRDTCGPVRAVLLPGDPSGDSACSGPVFAAVSGVRYLARGANDTVAQLNFAYVFYAGAPYFIAQSRLLFLKSAGVLGIQNRALSFARRPFTHYLFRPVTPTLPPTDVEEIGCVMIDSAHRAGTPEGFDLMAGMVPGDIPWTGLISTDRKFAVTLINLGRRNGPSLYREASRAHLTPGSVLIYDSPVYILNRDSCGANVAVARGSVYETLDAVHFSAWDNDAWRERVDGAGRSLNLPLKISVYPGLAQEVKGDTLFPAPPGHRADAYLRGVR